MGSFWWHFWGKIDEKRDLRILLVSEAIWKRNLMKFSWKKWEIRCSRCSVSANSRKSMFSLFQWFSAPKASKKRWTMKHLGSRQARKSIRKTSWNLVCFFRWFLMDFGAIWGGFEGSFGRLGAILGGPGRVLDASPKGVFDRVVPRGSQRAIWDHFGFIFDRF